MWQTASDFLIFVGWIWENFSLLLGKIFSPIQFIYTFLKEAVSSAFASPEAFALEYTLPEGAVSTVAGIPYFNYLIFALIVGFLILCLMFILKTFLKT